jgi:REP element-mobilizing transposase RayT
MDDALRYFHGDRYALLAWVVMPNHVHVLLQTADFPMSGIVESWKKFTAHRINEALHRQGRFWAPDYWDTYMRDRDQRVRTVRYIEGNPVRAQLVREPRGWP